MSFSILKCPLRVKKLIPENSAKTVNQTGNFYFQPKRKTAISPPIFNIFEPKNPNLKKIADLKVYGNLKYNRGARRYQHHCGGY